MVVSPFEDVHQRIPFSEHVVHSVIFLRLWQYRLVSCHPVELFPYDFHYRFAHVLSPFPVLGLGPPVLSDTVLVVQMVNVVYQPDYHLAVEVVSAVEELPFHMLETCKSEEPFSRALVCPVAV